MVKGQVQAIKPWAGKKDRLQKMHAVATMHAGSSGQPGYVALQKVDLLKTASSFDDFVERRCGSQILCPSRCMRRAWTRRSLLLDCTTRSSRWYPA